MAEVEETAEKSEQAINDLKEEEEEEEKWAKFYSSNHQILLVGEGDFSFSLSLATSFGSASNIVASSLDSHELVIKNYKKAKSNLEMLEKLGGCVLHGVDCTKMKFHTDLQMRKFDRIIYNFPHAGFHGKEDSDRVIGKHRNLVHGFFRNASRMLRASGEIHVTHKTKHPYSDWRIQELARQNSLMLITCNGFKKEDFPGYENKRGDSDRCDEPFPLGECCTYKFRFSPTKKKTTTSKRTLDIPPTNNPQFPTGLQHHLNSFERLPPLENPTQVVNCSPQSVWFPPARRIRSEYDSPALGDCRTPLNFRLSSTAGKMIASEVFSGYRDPQQHLQTPSSQLHLSSLEPPLPLENLSKVMNYPPPTVLSRVVNYTLQSVFSPPSYSIRTDYHSHFNHPLEMFSGNDHERSFLYEHRLGFHRHNTEEPGRSGFHEGRFDIDRYNAAEPGRLFDNHVNQHRELHHHDQQHLRRFI